jgi:hypothetical protein
MDNLVQALDNPEYGEEPWFRVTACSWESFNLNLTAEILDESQMKVVEQWNISAIGTREYSISDVNGGGLNYHQDDHPLIQKYLDLHVHLTFSGTPISVESVVGELWLAHRSKVDDWIAFDAFLNTQERLDVLLKGGHGQLAEGPRFLLLEYSDVLSRHGQHPSFHGERPPKKWDGEKFVEELSTLSLIHFGNSFIVAEMFQANRIC